ncbi:MAG: hypothetical protein LJF06_00500 [Gemmatimonadetes bacterium]|nr:hypothetical protein [Gemmatimonadota bacterium]
MKRRWIPVIVLLLLAFVPGVAHACAVCFDPRDKSNGTFLLSTAFLSLVPVGILGSMGMWLRKRLRDVKDDEEDEGDRASEDN